jgi:uncharacterized protein (DUF362 family)
MNKKIFRHEGKLKSPQKLLTRRDFLAISGLAAAGLAVTGYRNREKGSLYIPADNKSKVAVVKAESYDIQILRREIRNMFDQIGGLEDIIKPGARVAMKVNLTGGLFYSKEYAQVGIDAHWTHPGLVKAVGEAIINAGAKELYIMESLYEDTTFKIAGYPEIADALAARLINLDKPDPYSDFIHQKVGDNWLVYEEFIFNRLVMETDAFVSIAKLKCHGTCGVTLSMKNHVGLVPVKYYRTNALSNNRSAMHGTLKESGIRLPKVVVDLVHARPIDLSIIDGIHTTEGGEGPWIKNTFGMVKPGVIIAGKNPVATDSVAAAVMGFNPNARAYETPFVNSLNHLALACEKGLGTNILDEIEVLGPKIEEVSFPFKPCSRSV